MGDSRASRTPALIALALLLLTAGCGRSTVGGGAGSSERTASPSHSPSPSQPLACASLERPSARANASMAYMPTLGEAVMFGGWSDPASSLLGDTWTWRAGCWDRVPASTSPSPRVAMAMAYDPVRNVVVAFGGRIDPSLPQCSSETWLWDGHSWSKASKGPALSESWAVFDPNVQRTVVYGSASGGIPQTWTWDGAQWHQADVSNPPARSGAGMAFDSSSGTLLLFGGIGLQTMTLLNDTWAWNGSAWAKLNPSHSPSPRQAFGIASFSAQREVVLIGGNSQHGFVNDAWRWIGSDWVQAPGVGARGDAVAVDVGSAVLLFGGEDTNSYKNDSFVWNGSTWAAS